MTRDDAARKILVLTPQFPYPPQQGTTIRNYNLIAGLARRHEVHLLSFGDPDNDSRGTPVDDLCQTVHVVQPPHRTMGQRVKGLLFSRLPDMAQRLPSAEFGAALRQIMERAEPDVVEVEGIELAQYLFQASELRGDRARPLLVFDDHNAEYVLQQRAFETDVRQLWPFGADRQSQQGILRARRWIGAAYSFIQWRRLRGYERRACRTADRVVAVSETDAAVLRNLVPNLEPAIVPNGVDIDFYTAAFEPLAESERPGRKDLVFTAKMDFRPNVDAVLWFVQEVLPLIRQESPETRFWAVGKNPDARLAPLSEDPGVRVTGWVDDQRPYIAAAAVYVIPLRIGGGTRLKVLEAMAMSKATVSTTLGCEGFELEPGRELVIADTPAEFAAKVLALLRDPERRQALGKAAYQFAASTYDWSMIVPGLERVYTTAEEARRT
jgi:glycosyltransferase involved in cell wall biosynthesis